MVPEGDTIFRSAAVLHRWLQGRRITGARSYGGAAAVGSLVGTTVAGAEAKGKHLLITFAADAGGRHVLRTHMRMTGSWHVYETGAKWRRPSRQATLVLEAGDRIAVGFNIPVVELTTEVEAGRGRSIAALGPDVLIDPFNLDEVVRRAGLSPPDRPIGDLLLDQRVAAGIGNIYRCESLFRRGVHPWTPRGALDAAAIGALVLEASTLMRANIGSASGRRSFAGLIADGSAGGPQRPWVYRRKGRPCRRCGALILARRLGEQARTAFWCPDCQPMQSADALRGGGTIR